MSIPPGIGPPFEMIESEFVLQFLVLLLDGPPVMCQSHQRAERRRWRERDEIRFDARGRTEIAFEEDPHLWGATMRPARCGRTTDGSKLCVPGPIRTVAPADDAPSPSRQLLGNRADRFRVGHPRAVHRQRRRDAHRVLETAAMEILTQCAVVT